MYSDVIDLLSSAILVREESDFLGLALKRDYTKVYVSPLTLRKYIH